MTDAEVRELQAALNLVLLADIPLARMDPEVHIRFATDIVRARWRCAATLDHLRRIGVAGRK